MGLKFSFRNFLRAAVSLTGSLLLIAPVPAISGQSDALQRDHALTRNDLWRLIHYGCSASSTIGLAFPCEEVIRHKNLSYATLKVASNHILTVPLARISGIEEAGRLGEAGAELWQAAWTAQHFLDVSSGRVMPRKYIGIAINSAEGRSQDQMHLHTACVKPAARTALALSAQTIGTEWSNVLVMGVPYRVRWIDASDFTHINPFALLPATVRKSPSEMARQSLTAIGADSVSGAGGFYLLADQTRGNYSASGERLLDFECRLL